MNLTKIVLALSLLLISVPVYGRFYNPRAFINRALFVSSGLRSTNSELSEVLKKEQSTFYSLVEEAGLSDMLNDSKQNFTVFAINNDYFKADSELATYLKPENRERLVSFVKSHIVSGEMTGDSLVYSVKSIKGQNITVRVDSSILLVNDVKVSGKPIFAKNGPIVVVERPIVAF